MAIELLLGRKQFLPQFTQAGSSEVMIELDATISETHKYGNTATDFPIEDGSSISDHIKKQAPRLIIEGFITNSPIKSIIQSRDPAVVAGTRVSDNHSILLAIAGVGEFSTPILVDIFTKLTIFTDMLLTSLDIPRDQNTGDALRFTAEFVQIQKVSLDEATISYTSGKKAGAGISDSAQKKKTTGTKTAATASADKKSYLKQLSDSLNTWGRQ